jgi:hypothetical protein
MKVSKKFLKPLAILMTVCMLVQLGAVSGTEKERANAENVEFVFCGDIDPQKAQLIIDIINGEEVMFQINSSCAHLLAITTVQEIQHRVSATAPRCRRITYRVTYCTHLNCNYAVYTQTGSASIFCCP